MALELDATLQFIEEMEFSITSGSDHQVTIDAGVADGGMNRGPTPMELILMGTAGCTAMDVISILRKKRQEVTAYQVHIHGTRAPTHPMVFTAITIEHVVSGHHISGESVAHAIDLSVTKYCGAHAMLSKTATITTSYRILEAKAA